MLATPLRNGAYERLEGGMGPARAARKLPWKRIAIGCSILMGLVWFFGPRSDAVSTNSPTPGFPQDIYPEDKTAYASPPPPSSSSSSSSPPASSAHPRPTSPETDPDRLGTVHCTAPYAPHLPRAQYALMIDAGSTGSRIHVYKFHYCSGPSATYEYEVFRMTQPGLSGPPGARVDVPSSPSPTDDTDDADMGEGEGEGEGEVRWTPEDAATSLDVLLDEAVRVVPETLHACTPLAVKATAGLRLLGPAASAAILEAVEAHIRRMYPFAVAQGAVGMMEGRDEGVYAWLTVNYLMGGIGSGSTYAVLDLGGGSTQIVFEPERAPGVLRLEEGAHRYDLAFGGEERVLYQHSYLGYGLKSARQSVHRVVEFMDRLRQARAAEGELLRVANPCLAQGTTKEVDVPLDEGTVRVLMAGEDVGSFEACNRVLELVMAKDAVCAVKPCSFDGVYQPSLLDAFPTGKVLLLSYFYDRIVPLIPPLPAGVQPEISVSMLATLARQVCAGPKSWEEHWGTRPDVMEELDGRPEWCLDLTFMHALLRLGYEFTDARDVALGKRIEGTELGWCLGATIVLLGEGEVRCAA